MNLASMIPDNPLDLMMKSLKIGGIILATYVVAGLFLAAYYRVTAGDAMDTDTSGGVSKSEFETYVDDNAPSTLAGAAKTMGSVLEFIMPYEV